VHDLEALKNKFQIDNPTKRKILFEFHIESLKFETGAKSLLTSINVSSKSNARSDAFVTKTTLSSMKQQDC
jgi:hypothetical protein